MSVSAFYIACRNGDLDTVEQLLPTMTLDEINQIEPNGTTSLHAACYFSRPQIVKLLLDRGALRTIRNNYGCTPYDEAATEQVKELFARPFADVQTRVSTDLLLEQTIEWVSVEYGRYGWLNKTCIYNKDVDTAVDSIINDEQFHDVSTTHKIEYFLNKARQTRDVKWLIQAYSADVNFCQTVNKALASRSIRVNPFSDEKNIDPFVSIFLHHNALKQYRYTGKCYRGIKLSTKEFEENYKVGRTLLIKPFMSTSKSRRIAEQFATAASSNLRPLSVLCIYTIPDRTLSYRDNVVLNISSISEYPLEEEVLILPFTSVQIRSVNHLPSGLIEIEMGWYSFIEKRVVT